jgi:hypothetical protein
MNPPDFYLVARILDGAPPLGKCHGPAFASVTRRAAPRHGRNAAGSIRDRPRMREQKRQSKNPPRISAGGF